MQVLLLHEWIISVALQAQLLRRVDAQQSMEFALMRIVAVQAAAVLNRLVDMVLERQDVTCLA
jgi:hypothetical protein